MENSDHQSDKQQGTSRVLAHTLPEELNCKVILDPREFLEWCKKDKKIKIMDEANPVLPNVYLKDISLHKKGPLEDKMYAKSRKYYLNIRRGNTLCETYGEQGESKDLFFCRRGMIKFYDLDPEFLNPNSQLTFQHARVRNVIFRDLDRLLQQNKETTKRKFHLYSLFKQNGEHCQIGYRKQLDAWLMASKNVTIIVRTLDDLQHYHKQRFYWAKLIAKQFWEELSRMTQQQVQELKTYLHGKTLIGEHCGDQKHQHITKYDKIEIRFYAIVDNTSPQSCLPVEEAFKAFDMFGFTKVSTKITKDLKSKDQVYSQIGRLLKQTATGSLAVEGQGSVLYIVSEDMQSGQQTVVSLCKLKSTEYLILRKLREMLKLVVNKKNQSTSNTLEKFKFEMKNIVQHFYPPPKALKYYERVAQLAFSEIANRIEEIDEAQLRYRFVAFLDQVLKESITEEQAPTAGEVTAKNTKPMRVVVICLPLSFDTDFHKALKEKYNCKAEDSYRFGMDNKNPSVNVSLVNLVPRITEEAKPSATETHFVVCVYSAAQIKSVADSLENQKAPYAQSIVSFVRSQDKLKSLELLHSKIKAFESLCQEKKLSFSVVAPDQNKSASVLQVIAKLSLATASTPKSNPTEFKRYFVIPLLYPGSGKSRLRDLLVKEKLIDRYLSTDDMRQQIYTQQLAAHPEYKDKTSQEMFKLSRAILKERYLQQLQVLINLPRPKDKNQVVFLDRVFVPYNIDEQFDLFDPTSTVYSLIFLTEKSEGCVIGEHRYPYSVNYFLACLRRCVQREDHSSMSTDPITTFKILLMFMQMFRNCTLNPAQLSKRIPNSKVIKLKLAGAAAEPGKELPGFKKIVDKLNQCLYMVNPGHEPMDSPIHTEFVELFYTLQKWYLYDPTEKQVVDRFRQQIKEILT